MASRMPDGGPEIFCSLQGEGVGLGEPAVFLRLAGCNLSCRWCDTRYAWDWKAYDPREVTLKLKPEEVGQEILKFRSRYLVVTGGEPLLQQDELLRLFRLLDQGTFIEVETNGTILPKSELVSLVSRWSVSPKLSNSGVPQDQREVPQVYQLFSALPSSFFKFVLEKEGDLEELEELVRKYNLPSEKIVLMPQARDKRTLARRSRWLAEVCKTKGYRFSTRLQVLLWENRRGA